MKTLRQAVEQIMSPLTRRVRLMVGRAVLHLVDDARRMQELQVEGLKGEVLAGVERFQQYGFSSVPLPDAEALLLCVGGNRSHAVAVAVDDRRYRPANRPAGEVALYHYQGDFIRLKEGRIIEVVAGAALEVTAPVVTVVASSQVTLDTPNCTITGNLAVNGNATIDGTGQVTGALSSTTSIADPNGTMQAMRDTYDMHTHQESGGGTTNTPLPEM